MVKIYMEERRGRIEGRMRPDQYAATKGFPGRRKWKDGILWFENTAANLEYVRGLFPDAEWIDAEEHLRKLEELRQLEQDTVEAKAQDGPVNLPDWKFKTEPYEHQKKALSLARGRNAFGYFMEMGTGKSKTAIDDMAWLFLHGHIDGVLLLAPNGVHRQWVREQIPTHLLDDIPIEAAYHSSGKRPSASILRPSNCLKFFAVNIEALSHKSGIEVCQNFLSGCRKPMIILDESSRIKNPSAKRTKAAISLGKTVPYRRILSGAPVTKGLEDLYSQFLFLDENILGFRSFYTFRNRYCIMGGFEMKQIVGYRNIEELQHKINAHTFRVTKEDCLDLPEKVYVQREVELTPEQKKLYKQLKEDFLVELDNGDIVDGSLAITRLLRFQQLLSGFLPTEESILEVPTNRFKVLQDVVEEAQGKTIVWARFKREILEIAKMYGDQAVTYYGELNSNQREDNLERFKKDPSCRLFVAQPASGGIGLNITEATTAVYFSNDFNADVRWQSEDRCHRIGQHHSVTYVDMVVRGTIDTMVLKALKEKKNLADLAMDRRAVLEEL